MNPFKTLILFLFLFTTQRSTAQNIDINILKAVNPENPSSDFWKISSSSVYWLSGGITLGTLGYGLIKNDKRFRHNGYELLITSGIGISSTALLKKLFDRTRPADKYPGEVFVSSTTNGKSFPSGHTSEAFAVATTLSMQYKKWYVVAPAYLWAGCISYSRMYLGKHYPSDVLAGAVVGVASSYLGHFLTKKLFRN